MFLYASGNYRPRLSVSVIRTSIPHLFEQKKNVVSKLFASALCEEFHLSNRFAANSYLFPYTISSLSRNKDFRTSNHRITKVKYKSNTSTIVHLPDSSLD